MISSDIGNYITKRVEQICEATGTKAGSFTDGVSFRSESDSIVLCWEIPENSFYIEVFPISPNERVKKFEFPCMEVAIVAFNMWKTYYELVVKENFKMF
jgi:hypothetical protein